MSEEWPRRKSEMLTMREFTHLQLVCKEGHRVTSLESDGPYGSIFGSLAEKGYVTMEKGERWWIAYATPLGRLIYGLHT